MSLIVWRGRDAENREETSLHHIQERYIKMIRKLKSGEFRIYSRHVDPKTKKRKNLGTFPSREKAEEHERAIQYFKRH
jgi:hypothetical protein